MQKVLIFGGTGLVGEKLSRLLKVNGFSVKIVSRSAQPNQDIPIIEYNPAKNQYPIEEICEANVILFLQGAGIADKPWTEERKKLIVQSRVDPILAVYNILEKHEHACQHILSASAIGIYGDRGAEVLTEEMSSKGNSFLEYSVSKWEEAIFSQNKISTAAVRIGLVLSTDGGALPELLNPIKFGVSPYFFPGKEWYAWIHIDDLCGIFLHIILNKLSGIYNGVSPNPIQTKQLAIAFTKVKKAIVVPAPKIAAAIILGNRKSLILNSTNCSAKKIVSTEYTFKYPDIESALKNLIN